MEFMNATLGPRESYTIYEFLHHISLITEEKLDRQLYRVLMIVCEVLSAT